MNSNNSNNSSVTDKYELFFQKVVTAKINISSKKIPDETKISDYYDFLKKYYYIQKDAATEFSDEEASVYDSILVNYDDIIEKVQDILYNTKSSNSNSTNVSTNMVSGDVLQGFNKTIVDEELKNYTNFNFSLLYDINVLVFFVYKKNKQIYTEVVKDEDHKLKNDLTMAAYVSNFIDEYGDDTIIKEITTIPSDQVEKQIIQLCMAKDFNESNKIMESILPKSNTSKSSNVKAIRPFLGGSFLTNTFDKLHTKCMSFFITNGVVKNKELLKLLTIYDKMVKIQSRSLKLDSKNAKKYDGSNFFDDNGYYKGPATALTNRLWYLIFVKTKYKNLNNMLKKLKIKYTNEVDKEKLIKAFTEFHENTIEKLEDKLKITNNNIKLYRDDKESLKYTTEQYVIKKIIINLRDIKTKLYTIPDKSISDIDNYVKNDKGSHIAITFSYYLKTLDRPDILLYLFDIMNSNSLSNNNGKLSGFNIQKIKEDCTRLKYYVKAVTELIINYYNGVYKNASNLNEIKYYLKLFLDIDLNDNLPILEKIAKDITQNIDDLNKEYLITIESVKNNSDNLIIKSPYVLNKVASMLADLPNKYLVDIKEEKTITIEFEDYNNTQGKSLFWKKQLPLSLTKKYRDILYNIKILNDINSSGKFYYDDPSITKNVFNKFKVNNLLKYDYELYNGNEDLKSITNILNGLEDIKISDKDLIKVDYITPQTGGRNIYCKVLGKRRKIIIKNKKQYVTYDKKLITLNLAKKMETKMIKKQKK